MNFRRFLAPALAVLLVAGIGARTPGSVSESTADEAMRQSFAYPELGAEFVVNLASAIVNQLVFVTTHPGARVAARRDLVLAYPG